MKEEEIVNATLYSPSGAVIRTWESVVAFSMFEFSSLPKPPVIKLVRDESPVAIIHLGKGQVITFEPVEKR